MLKSREMMILVTFFSLWLTNYFADNQQGILAFGLLLTVGLLHGSNDLQLLKRTFNTKSKTLGVFNLAMYVGVVLVAFSLFYFVPFITLLMFIVVSGYHFGEQHWNERLVFSIWARPLYLFYGLFILFLLFSLNTTPTTLVIKQLTNLDVPGFWYYLGALFFGTLFLASLFLVRLEKAINNADLFFELFLLLVFAVVFTVASLIWAFTIYFIFWHAIPSIKEQLQFLYGEVSKRTTLKYIKSSALIWILSIGGLYLFNALIAAQEQLFITVFFAFLGAITFAHTLIIAKMFHKVS